MNLGNKSEENMKADSSCGKNNNGYNASNSSASVYEEDSSDESIDINRDPFATKKKKFKQMHEADDGIVSQNNATIWHCGAPDLVSLDSAENTFKSTTQNPGIVINESGSGAVLTKVDDELKLARRRQSNRESARRSRMRKQEEIKKLRALVELLKAESSELKNDVLRLSESYLKLKDENKSMMVQLRQRHGVDAISYLESLMPHN